MGDQITHRGGQHGDPAHEAMTELSGLYNQLRDEHGEQAGRVLLDLVTRCLDRVAGREELLAAGLDDLRRGEWQSVRDRLDEMEE